MQSGKLLRTGLFGVGIDIIEIDRIRLAVERRGDRFLDKVFTNSEKHYCNAKPNRFASFAARFAAKEAVLKAIGTGLGSCAWKDVEITREDGQRPEVLLGGTAADLAKEKGISVVLISMSHNRSQAVAFAVAAGMGEYQCGL